MDNLKKYRKIRRRLECASGTIAILIGAGISSSLGIYGNKFISLDTLLSFSITVGFSIVLGNISIIIADRWYDKSINK